MGSGLGAWRYFLRELKVGGAILFQSWKPRGVATAGIACCDHDARLVLGGIGLQAWFTRRMCCQRPLLLCDVADFGQIPGFALAMEGLLRWEAMVREKNSGQGLTIWCLARILQVMVAAGSCFTARAIRRDAILFSGPGRTDQLTGNYLICMPPSEDILARLHNADWKKIYPKLIAFTKWRLSRGYRLRRGLKPKDIVQEAITSVAEGRRNWNPARDPDLTKYLAGVISGLISNESNLVEHKYRDRNGSLDMDAFAGLMHDPFVLTTSAECEKVLMNIMKQETADDRRLRVILNGLIAGLSPAEIAQKHGIDRKDVYTLSRKLRRRILSAMARHECWEDILG